jgi:hypothetical protein
MGAQYCRDGGRALVDSISEPVRGGPQDRRTAIAGAPGAHSATGDAEFAGDDARDRGKWSNLARVGSARLAACACAISSVVSAAALGTWRAN